MDFCGLYGFGTAVFFGCLQWSESLFYDKLAAVASAMPKESSLVMKALKDTEGFDLEAGRVILGNTATTTAVRAGQVYGGPFVRGTGRGRRSRSISVLFKQGEAKAL